MRGWNGSFAASPSASVGAARLGVVDAFGINPFGTSSLRGFVNSGGRFQIAPSQREKAACFLTKAVFFLMLVGLYAAW